MEGQYWAVWVIVSLLNNTTLKEYIPQQKETVIGMFTQTGYLILMDGDMNLKTYNLNLKRVKQKQWEWQRE